MFISQSQIGHYAAIGGSHPGDALPLAVTQSTMHAMAGVSRVKNPWHWGKARAVGTVRRQRCTDYPLLPQFLGPQCWGKT